MPPIVIRSISQAWNPILYKKTIPIEQEEYKKSQNKFLIFMDKKTNEIPPAKTATNPVGWIQYKNPENNANKQQSEYFPVSENLWRKRTAQTNTHANESCAKE
jgi:hypothetical protein